MISAAASLAGRHGEAPVLEEVRAEATIEDLFAEVAVTQRYRNSEATNIEAVYTFPLPPDGVLLGFEVEIGDRRLAGTVVAKAAAERRYEDAITDGDAAVLLEQAGPGLYTASIGNLLPNETATVRFRYGLLLRWNGARVRLALPTTVAPRYGDPAAAGLAPHQAPEHGFDTGPRFSVRVAVRGLLADARFDCPSHDVAVTAHPGETVIDLAGRPAMDRDFVLEARSSRREASSALVDRDADGWVVTASVRPEIPDDSRERRSVKVVVDCSGSMGGDSMAQAKAGLERILDGLRDGDLFDIVAFGTGHRALFGRETAVSSTSLAEARRFVRALDADMGGTEIGGALAAAYRSGGTADLPRDLLLITDGQVWNTGEVLARARAAGHRIFTVGVGSAAAEPFVRELADCTGGACELVAPREDMAERIHRHFQRMYAPRARGAALRLPAPAIRTLPDPVPAVHGGDTLHLFAWFAERPEGEIGLDVTLADGRTLRHRARIGRPRGALAAVPEDGRLPSSLARLAAARRLATMTGGEAATALALRHQLVSPWTSCIVVHVRAEDEKAEDLPALRKVRQVVPAGWHGMGSVYAEQGLPRIMDATSEQVDLAPADRAGRAMFSRIRAAASRRAVGLHDFVARLNGEPLEPLPTLGVLAALGMPEAVLSALRQLLGRGEDEARIVATLLHLLAQSEAGDRLQRPARRRIIRAHKTAQPPQSLVDAVAAALERWDDTSAPRQMSGA